MSPSSASTGFEGMTSSLSYSEVTRFVLCGLEQLSKSRERRRVWMMLVFAVFLGELGRGHDRNNQMREHSPDC